ncbi:MAG: hypothetical protein LKI42_05115 [Bacteroidales bacterium]|jgi:hypothetical protein|nr:hypothetical protein [Bacteroidales bacterium]MCI1785521.1 hypothetical protein [Bacteroidales bacterium]
MKPLSNYDYCCSKDGHGLKYPGFSVVFIQTFSIDPIRKFRIPAEYDKYDGKNGLSDEDFLRGGDMVFLEKADALKIPVASMHKSIENQIFVIPDNDSGNYDDKNVCRFSLRGFDFDMQIVPEEDDDSVPVNMSCHVNVEMSLFFGHTVSFTYRFLFNGHAGTLSEPVGTDHIIALLSTYLGAEYWSKEKDNDSGTDINYETGFSIADFHFDEEGNPLAGGCGFRISGKGRMFDQITLRYKKFIYRYCSEFRKDAKKGDVIKYNKWRKKSPLSTDSDYHYAMVDIWENVMHPLVTADGAEDLFGKNHQPRLSEAEIVEHIRNYHKPELIGLLTLYPGEWPYRDAASYDEVCGGNIAIDTDDLVLVNNNMCLVLGTYGRRGGDIPKHDEGGNAKKGVDWAEHLKERARYHVSWPEYLLILQMVIAKKHIISLANDELIDATLNADDNSSSELIGKNARLSMRLSRMVLQLDAVKYSKFTSHKIMFDRTTARLNLDKDMERLDGMMDMVDDSLHNLSDYKAMKSDFLLNIILAIISVTSTFELFFQNAEMPFLTYFGIRSGGLAATVVAVVACITIFGILLILSDTLKNIWGKIKSWV